MSSYSVPISLRPPHEIFHQVVVLNDDIIIMKIYTIREMTGLRRKEKVAEVDMAFLSVPLVYDTTLSNGVRGAHST